MVQCRSFSLSKQERMSLKFLSPLKKYLLCTSTQSQINTNNPDSPKRPGQSCSLIDRERMYAKSWNLVVLCSVYQELELRLNNSANTNQPTLSWHGKEHSMKPDTDTLAGNTRWLTGDRQTSAS